MSESVAQDQLRAFVERLERMHEERQSIADDIKEIYAEAKGNGFDVPTLKAVLKIRREDPNERLEREAILDLYLSALGMHAALDEDGRPLARARAPAREPIEEFPPETANEVQHPGSGDGLETAEVGDLAGRGDLPPHADGMVRTARTEASAVTGRRDGQPIPESTVYQFKPKPHDGPVSSSGLPRMHGCLNLDACGGRWNLRCSACERAWNDGAASDGDAA